MKSNLLAALLVLPLFFLSACANPGTTGAGDPLHLPMIRFYNSSLGVGDYLVEVTPGGELTVQEHRGSTDTDVRRSAMHLTPQQIQTIQAAFKGWKSLKSSYPGEWSVLVQITYDGYTVEAHDLEQAPAGFTNAMATLVKLARSAVATSTAPAQVPTSAPAVTPSPAAPAVTPGPILVPRE